jgi:galactokinase
MEQSDAACFGRLLVESHESLRDRLRVSSDALNRLVEAALASGAPGARLTGAGFGGCAVVFCKKSDVPKVRAGLLERYYRGRTGFREHDHLIEAEAADGALYQHPKRYNNSC